MRWLVLRLQFHSCTCLTAFVMQSFTATRPQRSVLNRLALFNKRGWISKSIGRFAIRLRPCEFAIQGHTSWQDTKRSNVFNPLSTHQHMLSYIVDAEVWKMIFHLFGVLVRAVRWREGWKDLMRAFLETEFTSFWEHGNGGMSIFLAGFKDLFDVYPES